MTFPHEAYGAVIQEAMEIVADRDKKGRNAAIGFYAGFPHGHQDISFELSRRVGRILGAELCGRVAVMREDALDLLNYAAFYVMLLDKECGLIGTGAQTAPVAPSTPPLRSI